MIKALLQTQLAHVIIDLYSITVIAADLQVVPTKKEFQGDFTLNVFPLAGKVKKSPPDLAAELGRSMVDKQYILAFDVVQGFLNMTIRDEIWIDALQTIQNSNHFGHGAQKEESVLVEFASPNTNKPLHLGHVRNMLLGTSIARILEVSGYTVNRIQVINDRGIAICKSMLAWKNWAKGATPETTGIKGDHFVGDYYVLFEKEFSKEYLQWQSSPEAQEVFNSRKDKSQDAKTFYKEYKNVYFNTFSYLGKEARDLLLLWEKNDPDTISLWNRMNQWVYSGFDKTYARMGVSFDHTDHESVTYLLGKEAVKRGLQKGIFYSKPDQSVWIDLTAAGMDQNWSCEVMALLSISPRIWVRLRCAMRNIK